MSEDEGSTSSTSTSASESESESETESSSEDSDGSDEGDDELIEGEVILFHPQQYVQIYPCSRRRVLKESHLYDLNTAAYHVNRL